MQPQSRDRRKNGRDSAQRHSEHQLPDPRRMTARELIEEAEEILARQAWITRPEANMLGVLLIGMNGVQVITLVDEPDNTDVIEGEAEVIDEVIIPHDPEMIRQAEGWLEDCFEDLPADLSAIEIVNAVNRYYHGGWQGFVSDAS